MTGTGRAFVALSENNYRALTPSFARIVGEVWPGEVELLDPTRGERRAVALARVVRRAGRYETVIVDGSVGLRAAYVDLFAAAAIGRRRRAPAVVVSDCTWKLGVSPIDRAALRAGIRLVDSPRVSYCVLTNDEVRIFPRTWGVDPDRVHFTPWPYILKAHELEPLSDAPSGVFAGGDSMRDYGPLIEASRGLDADVTIATRLQDVTSRTDVAPNVRVVSITHSEFIEQLRRALVVVVPLIETHERSAGQTTYVNALALGKLVVATDCLGIRDYIDDGRTGLLVPPGDAAALRETLAWAVDPANRDEVERIASRARETAHSRCGPDDYVANLLRVARAARERQRAAAS